MYKEQFSQGWENQNLQKDIVSEEIKNVVRKKFSREIGGYESHHPHLLATLFSSG